MDSELESRVIDEYIKKAIESSREEDNIGPELIQQSILDVWAGTFIYNFFVDEDARLRQSVIDFVCQHRPGSNPQLGRHDLFGSCNFNVEIVFDDGTALFRFPVPRLVAFPDDKVRPRSPPPAMSATTRPSPCRTSTTGAPPPRIPLA